MSDMSEACAAIRQDEADKRDAARYRFLRKHLNTKPIFSWGEATEKWTDDFDGQVDAFMARDYQSKGISSAPSDKQYEPGSAS